LQIIPNEAEPLSVGIPGRAWNEGIHSGSRLCLESLAFEAPASSVLQTLHNEAEPLSVGIPGRAWNEGSCSCTICLKIRETDDIKGFI